MASVEQVGYVLGRDLNASMRLEVQHLIYRMYYRFILHPKIPVSPDMKIAEIGTGTGIWVVDVASELPPTVQIDAYDISDSQFPPKYCWPSNVTFGVLDSFADVPEHLVGKYDVVHLRLWCIVVKNGDPSALIQHALKLLKPGGHIQWEDAWLGGSTVKGETAEDFWSLANLTFDICSLKFDWLRDIAQHVEKQGFNVIQSAVGTATPAVIPGITKTFLGAFFEFFALAYKIAPPASMPEESEAYGKLWATIDATMKGESLHWNPVNVLAQKPLTQ